MDKGAQAQKIAVLHPWAHDEMLEPVGHKENPFRRDHRIEEKFIVMYSGNHSVCHPLDTLLEAAYELRDDDSVIFLFVGEGDQKHRVKRFKEKHELFNILLLPYQEREKLRYSLCGADLHVVVMGEPFVGIVHPCKIYNILSVGSPFVVIGPEESHLTDIIGELGTGRRVDHGDVKGLTRLIRETQQLDSQKRQEIMEKSLELKKTYLSQTLGVQKLARIITG